MAKVVKTIPATRQLWTSRPLDRLKKRRVAGYARVSTDREEQETSYEAQLDYYRRFILSHDDWELVEIYADEGISATSTKHREGFNRMVTDAMTGKIDLIITKSVSRFARNTVDSLTIVRDLKEKGVEVYFEKENIWTLDSKGELLITIMSSLAQEESRSISENTTWGIRKRYADGKASVAYSRFLGYDAGFAVNQEEAETVKLIYDLFLDGYSSMAIKKELEQREIKTPGGGVKWHVSTIQSILRNEKYAGRALMQKGFTVDFLQKKQKKNEGELPQQYVEEHHEAIIPPKVFDEVQIELDRRKQLGASSTTDVFASKIRCGCCGGWYGAKLLHSTDQYRRKAYRCNNRYTTEGHPKTPLISKEDIEQCFIQALTKLILNKTVYIKDLREMQKIVADTEPLKKKIASMHMEVEKLKVEYLYEIRNSGAETEDHRNEIVEKHNELLTKITEAEEQINQDEMKAASIEKLINTLRASENAGLKFDPQLWTRTISYAEVNQDRTITLIFKGGIRAKVDLP